MTIGEKNITSLRRITIQYFFQNYILVAKCPLKHIHEIRTMRNEHWFSITIAILYIAPFLFRSTSYDTWFMTIGDRNITSIRRISNQYFFQNYILAAKCPLRPIHEIMTIKKELISNNNCNSVYNSIPVS